MALNQITTEEPDAIATKGANAVSTGEWATAAEAYELLVEGDPEQPEWRYQLAQAYEELGRLNDAIDVLTHPSLAGRDKTIRRLAKAFMEAKAFESAIPLVDKLIALFPNTGKYAEWKRICEVSGRIECGQNLVAGGRLDDAERLYLELLSQYPDEARAHLHLGQIYSQQGRWPDAIGQFRAGLAAEPQNLKLKTGLARALFKNGEMAEAISLLESDNRYSADPESLFLLQRCHAELHAWESVDKVATRLLSVLRTGDPLREAVLKARRDAQVQRDAEAADLLARAGDWDGAIARYRQLVERHRESPLAWLMLCAKLAEAGRDENAVIVLRDALDHHPEDRDIRAALSRMALSSFDEQGILRYANEAVATGNVDFEPLRWLARYHAERENWAEALEYAARAVALDPESASVRALLVRALTHLHRLQEALDEVENLLATGEKQVEALQLKGDILLRVGRLDEAIAVYCQALRLSRREPLITERLNSALLLKGKVEDYPLRPLEELPIAVDPSEIDAAMLPFLNMEVDKEGWNKRHRKMWRRAVDRAAAGRETRRDRKLVEQEYAVWASMGFDRYRTDRQELQSAPWSWRGRRLFLDGAGAARLRAVIFAAVLKELKPRSVLEVGSGNGVNLLTLAGAFPEIEFVGLELTKEGVGEAQRAQCDARTVEIMREYSPVELTDDSAVQRINFVQGDASALPFEDESFDLVLTVLAIEQMESIRSAALSEIARVSRHHVLMLEPFRDENQDGLKALYAHSRGYFRGSICELRDFGLEPLWATADFPQETFLGTALVLSERKDAKGSD
jgi:tetratricopeptide (TPR) repeat protein